MAINIVASQGGGASYATTLDVSIDFGTLAGRAIAVSAVGLSNAGGGGPLAMTSVVVDPAGANITLTGNGLVTSTGGSNYNQTNTGSQEFTFVGDSLPTGVKTVRLTMANGNSKPQMWVTTLNGVASQRGAVVNAWGNNSAPSVSITSEVGDTVVGHVKVLLSPADTYTLPATSPATQHKRILSTESDLRGAVLQRAGASGTISIAAQILNASAVPASDGWGGSAWSFVGTSVALAFTGTVGAQSGTVGTAFSWAGGSALSTFYSGGTAPYTYSVASGTLPAGLSINASTGVVSGTPTTAGSGAVTFRVTDAAAATVDSNSVSFTIAAAPATATTMSGPSGGQVGFASAAFTVGANGVITGTVTATPSDGGGGGTFSPASVAISSGTPVATFTYTPGTAGVKTIAISDNGGLTDAASISYTASATAATLTSSPLKNNTGTVLATVAFEAYVSNPTTGSLVVKKTGLTTNGSGVIAFTDAAMAAATSYRVVWRRTDTGAEGLETLTAT